MHAVIDAPALDHAPVDVSQHLRLAFKVCRVHQKYAAARGISLAELESEAFLALVRAGRQFQPERGCKFSSYAWKAIDHALRKMLRRRRLPTTSLTTLGVDEESDLEVADYRGSGVSVEDSDLLKHLLRTVPPRVKALIVRRYGLDGKSAKTFQELAGEEGNLGHARVEQLISGGLEKMRAAARRMGLTEAAAEDVA